MIETDQGGGAPAPAGGATRWPKGTSGNPRGGPKRPVPTTAQVERLMRRKFEVVFDGERERLPLAEALLLAIAHRALKGCVRSTGQLLELMQKAEAKREAEAREKAEAAARRAAARLAARREAEATARLRRQAEEEEAARDRAAADYGLEGPEMFDAEHALLRLGVLSFDAEGEPVIASWAVDMARRRNPALRLSDADERLLDRVVKLDLTPEPEGAGEDEADDPPDVAGPQPAAEAAGP